MNYINFGDLKQYLSKNTKYELASMFEEPIGCIKSIDLFDIIEGKVISFDLNVEQDVLNLLTIIKKGLI